MSRTNCARLLLRFRDIQKLCWTQSLKIRAQRREFLEIIRKNAARMARLTEDLLTLARVESGETRFETEPVAPIELLNDAEESFREIARAQGVDLKIVDPRGTTGSIDLFPPVLADREAIHQVFSNLIDNAMKYGRAGGRVELGARATERGIEFYVQDYRCRYLVRTPTTSLRAFLPCR